MRLMNPRGITKIILSIFIASSLALAAKNDYILVDGNSFAPQAIGQEITFREDLVYLVLDNSPDGFLKKNNGISRMLATAENAKGNDIHKQEYVANGMRFKIVSIFKLQYTDLESWDAEAREMYLGFSELLPDIDYSVVLSDVNNVLSTVSFSRLGNSSYRNNQ